MSWDVLHIITTLRTLRDGMDGTVFFSFFVYVSVITFSKLLIDV